MNDAPLHKELPFPDYDHIPAGTLPSRISGLGEAEVAQLVAYEKAHGNRLPILVILEKRLQDRQAGAETHGPRVPSTPEVNTGQPETTKAAEVTGPPVNPPSQGDPTNPAQPR